MRSDWRVILDRVLLLAMGILILVAAGALALIVEMLRCASVLP